MEHVIDELSSSLMEVHISTSKEDINFILRMNTAVITQVYILKGSSFVQKFDPPIVIKETDRLKANYQFYVGCVEILSSLSFFEYSHICVPLNCNEKLCNIFKTNKLFSAGWQLRPPCKTAHRDFVLFHDIGSSVININNNLDMLFQIKNLSLEDAIIITRVKNEIQGL